MYEHWSATMGMAKDALISAQEKQAKYYNKGHKDLEFQEGDQVMLSTQNLLPAVDLKRVSQKLTPRFIGPYKVEKKVSTTAYKLSLPPNIKVHPVFHVSLLKHYSPNKFEGRKEMPPPPEFFISPNSEPEFEVEKVLDKRTYYRKPQYLIKWKGYPLHEAT